MHKVTIRHYISKGSTHITVDGVELRDVLQADVKMRINELVVLEVFQHDANRKTRVKQYPIGELTILGNLE